MNGFVSLSTRSCVLAYLRSSVHACERLCMLVFVRADERGWVYKSVSVSVRVSIQARVRVCIRACMHAFVHQNVHVCDRACVFACVRA